MLKELLDPFHYYANPGFMTDPGEFACIFENLPQEIPALVQVVQGLLVHIFWSERCGLQLSEERKQEVQIRPVVRKLARVLKMDDRPLSYPRPLEKRLVGNCRDFSVLLCTMLRHQGIPSRARCGFATYFMPNHFEDHWVCEVWKPAERRWVMVDAQLDALQCQTLQIPFDPLDVPAGQFLTGGEAWQICRAGQANPDDFGIFDYHGMGFIRGDLLRDFLALNKIEILPWDFWGLLAKEDRDLTEDDLALLDCVASLTLAGNEAFPELRALFQHEPRLGLPQGWQP